MIEIGQDKWNGGFVCVERLKVDGVLTRSLAANVGNTIQPRGLPVWRPKFLDVGVNSEQETIEALIDALERPVDEAPTKVIHECLPFLAVLRSHYLLYLIDQQNCSVDLRGSKQVDQVVEDKSLTVTSPPVVALLRQELLLECSR